jgi:OTU domain-containing protein 6
LAEVEGLSLESEPASLNLKESRVTKAQKRRDKKSEKDKERVVLIAQQEQENKLGPRHLEEVRIKEILTSRRLQLHEVPSNGDW